MNQLLTEAIDRVLEEGFDPEAENYAIYMKMKPARGDKELQKKYDSISDRINSLLKKTKGVSDVSESDVSAGELAAYFSIDSVSADRRKGLISKLKSDLKAVDKSIRLQED